MKKLLLSLALTTMSAVSFSQIDTLRSSDIPLEGTGFNEYQTTGLSFDVFPAYGKDEVWDYTNFSTYDSLHTQIMKDMSLSPNPNTPGANLANHIITKDASGNLKGEDWAYGYQDEMGIDLIDEGLKIKTFPEKLYFGSYDSTAIDLGGSLLVNVIKGIGTGTLKTNEGTYSDVFLLKQEIKFCSQYLGVWYCEPSDLTYSWHQKDINFSTIAQIYNGTENGEVSFSWHQPANVLSVESELIASQISIYPTIAENDINIVGTDIEKVELYNLKGERVLIDTKNHIDISNLSNGNYIYNVYVNGTVVKEGKLLKK